MAVTADKVVVELEAKLDKYDAKIKTSEREFTRSMEREAASARKAEEAVRKAADQKAAAGQRAATAAAKAAAANALAAERAARAEAAKAGAANTSAIAIQKARALEAAAAEKVAATDARRQASAERSAAATQRAKEREAAAAAKAALAEAGAAERAARADAARAAAADKSAINALKAAAIKQQMADREARAVERAADREARAREKAAKAQAAAVVKAQKDTAFIANSVRGGLAALGVAGAAQAARQLLAIADEAKNLEARLRLATAETGSFAQAQTDVRRIAAETRTGLTDVANLYGVIARTARDTGLAQAEVAQVTQTVTQSFIISGASASEAAGGLRQFLQGIQSGVLRGEEFNSVLENAPRLAKALADQLSGGNIGALRALAEEGKISSSEVLKAVKASGEAIAEEFKTLPVTFDQAMTQVRNAAVITFGAFDRGGEFSTALANFITDGTGGFASLEGAAEEFGISARGSIEGLGAAFQPVLNAGLQVFDLLGIRIQDFSADGRREIAGLLGAIDDAFNRSRLLREGEFSLYNLVTQGTAQVQPGQVPRANLRQDFLARAASSDNRLNRNRTNRTLANIAGNPLYDGGPTIGERVAGPARRTPAAADKKKKKGRSAESIRLEAEREEQAYQNELAAQNADILAARRALATAADAVAQFERDRIEIERQAYADQQNSLVSQNKRTRVQADELIRLEDQRASLARQAIDNREAERVARERVDVASAAIGNDIDLASAQERLAGTTAERRVLAERLLDLQYQQERIELEAVVASAEASEAQKKIAAARLAILAQLQAADQQDLDRSMEGPLARYRRSLDDPAAQVEQAVADRLQDVDDAIADTAAKMLGVKDPLIRSLLQTFIQQNVLKPLYDAAASGGGGSGVIAGIGKFFGGFFANGGVPPRGKLSIVGENGPEIIAGDGRARVIPMAKAIRPAAGNVQAARPQVSVVAPIQFDLSGVMMTEPLLRRMEARQQQYANQVAAAMGQSVLKAVPGKLQKFQQDGT